jgi:hypothetical protein
MAKLKPITSHIRGTVSKPPRSVALCIRIELYYNFELAIFLNTMYHAVSHQLTDSASSYIIIEPEQLTLLMTQHNDLVITNSHKKSIAWLTVELDDPDNVLQSFKEMDTCVFHFYTKRLSEVIFETNPEDVRLHEQHQLFSQLPQHDKHLMFTFEPVLALLKECQIAKCNAISEAKEVSDGYSKSEIVIDYLKDLQVNITNKHFIAITASIKQLILTHAAEFIDIQFVIITNTEILLRNHLVSKTIQVNLPGVKVAAPLILNKTLLNIVRELCKLKTHLEYCYDIDTAIVSVNQLHTSTKIDIKPSSEIKAIHEECLSQKDIATFTLKPVNDFDDSKQTLNALLKKNVALRATSIGSQVIFHNKCETDNFRSIEPYTIEQFQVYSEKASTLCMPPFYIQKTDLLSMLNHNVPLHAKLWQQLYKGDIRYYLDIEYMNSSSRKKTFLVKM